MRVKKYSQRFVEVGEWLARREVASCLWQIQWDTHRKLLLECWQLGKHVVLVQESHHGVSVYTEAADGSMEMPDIYAALEALEAS